MGTSAFGVQDGRISKGVLGALKIGDTLAGAASSLKAGLGDTSKIGAAIGDAASTVKAGVPGAVAATKLKLAPLGTVAALNPLATGVVAGGAGVAALNALGSNENQPVTKSAFGIEDNGLSKAGAHRAAATGLKRLMTERATPEARKAKRAQAQILESSWYKAQQAHEQVMASPAARQVRAANDALWRTQPGR